MRKITAAALPACLAAVAAGLAWSAWQPMARADLGACGDVFVVAEAECTVIPPSASCEAMCTPITVRASCDAQLAAQCRGGCDELPSIECQADCHADCTASCDELDPGEIDCTADCRADCSGRCDAGCEGQSDRASCEASCEGSCSASCDASCEVRPPMADCDASCEASCEGSCEVDTNLDCQLECQGEARLDCEADIEGECVANCQADEGALFCDGQFVDYGDSLQDCLDALRAKFNVRVEAEGDSGCDDAGVCTARGSVTASSDGLCSTVRPGALQSSSLSGVAVMTLALFGFVRRRRL